MSPLQKLIADLEAIPTKRDKPVHAMLLARRLEQMAAEEAGA